MTPSDTKWHQVKPSDAKWNWINPSDAKWTRVMPSEPEWHQVNPSDAKWIRVMPSETECTRVHLGAPYILRQPLYQFNCSTDMLHLASVQNIPDSAGPKKLCHNTSAPWRFPPPSPHHLEHRKYHCNTRSAVIALIAKLPATILLLGLVRFALFYEKLHHFYRANFVTQQPSQRVRGKM